MKTRTLLPLLFLWLSASLFATAQAVIRAGHFPNITMGKPF